MYYLTKEHPLQCSRWWLFLAGLGTARSSHRAVSSPAFFPRWCPSGTSRLRSISTPSTPSAAKSQGPIKSPIKSALPLLRPLIPRIVPPSPSLTHSIAPLVRCSRRLADMAELTGGCKVYSRDDRRLKPLFPLWDNPHHNSCTLFPLRPVVSGVY